MSRGNGKVMYFFRQRETVIEGKRQGGIMEITAEKIHRMKEGLGGITESRRP
jgi:hypothetical protein